jgi:hypothetical protein
MLYSSFWSSLFAFALAAAPYLRDLLLATTAAALVAGFQHLRYRRLLRLRESTLFAEEFARRLLEYLDVAVRNPEDFPGYLVAARRDAGLARESGSAAPFR